MGTAKSCRPCTYNSYSGFGPLYIFMTPNSKLRTPNFFLQLLAVFVYPISEKTLQSTDGNRAVELSSIAFLFTRMVTNTPNRGRKGIVFFDHIEGFFISTCLDQGDIALSARLCWTGMLARTGAVLGDKEGIRNGLRIEPVNRLSLIQSLVEFIWEEDRADLSAIITTRAFLQIHIARMPSYLRPELPSLSF